jgi:hypothetical protein
VFRTENDRSPTESSDPVVVVVSWTSLSTKSLGVICNELIVQLAELFSSRDEEEKKSTGFKTNLRCWRMRLSQRYETGIWER